MKHKEENTTILWRKDIRKHKNREESSGCVLDKRRNWVWKGCESIWKFWTELPHKSILLPKQNSHFRIKDFSFLHIFLSRTVGETSNQYTVKCHRKLRWGGLMNPPFPSSQWAFFFFMEGEINYLWQIHQCSDELPFLPGSLWRKTFFQCGYIRLV